LALILFPSNLDIIEKTNSNWG